MPIPPQEVLKVMRLYAASVTSHLMRLLMILLLRFLKSIEKLLSRSAVQLLAERFQSATVLSVIEITCCLIFQVSIFRCHFRMIDWMNASEVKLASRSNTMHYVDVILSPSLHKQSRGTIYVEVIRSTQFRYSK